MKYLASVVLYVLATIAGPPVIANGADEAVTGIDLFIEACRWQGLNPAMIRTGYAEFETVVTTPSKSEKEIQEEVEERSKGLREFFATRTEEGAQADLERVMEELPKAVRARSSGRRRSRIKVLFGGNDITFGKRRFEVVNFDPAAEVWEQPLTAIRRNATKQGGDNVLWDESAFMATISNGTVGGIAEFQAFGRMQGMVSKLTTVALLGGTDTEVFEFPQQAIEAFKGELARRESEGQLSLYQLAGQAEYDGGAIARVVETRAKGEVLAQRYWIDASRGHICPLIQYYLPNGRPQTEWKSSDYFLHERSGLWFPEHHSHTEYAPGTGEVRELREYTLDKTTLQINQEVSDEEFAVQIPEGATLLDDRSGKLARYRAAGPVTLSLAKGGLDLESNPALSPIGEAVQSAPPESRGGMALILTAVSLVIIAAALLLLWRRRGKSRGLAALLCLACLLGLGCSRGEDGDRRAVEPLVIEPEVIDFGRVREADGPLELAFKVINEDTRSIEIVGARSGCGCTVAELGEANVPAHGSLSVPVTVRVRGRVGPFANRILLELAGRPDPLTVSIQGEVVRDIWCSGQPIRCSAEPSSPFVEGTFEVHTVDWPQIDFDWSVLDEDMVVEEVSRSTKEGETVIKIRFRMDVPGDRYASVRHVKLKPVDDRISPLVVPVACYRPALRGNTLASSQALTPEQISLGMVPQGENRHFRIFGAPELIESVVIASSNGIPKGLDLELETGEETDVDARRVTVRVSDTASLGLFRGQVRLLSPDDTREFLVGVSGGVCPRGAEAVP
ncbi:MAG: DUF1573 domain-containing protein [Planctomycetes bacterium]|nr:DUF1573 domain-containing protein [Planctomycetota bacterium]